MNKSNFSISFVLLLAMTIACTNEKKEKIVEKPKYKPEEVITIWQKSVDNNDYNEAELFSTDEVLEYIKSMEEASAMDSLQVINSAFVDIKSTQKSDSIVELATTLKYEDGIQTNDTYVLVKRNGFWLIKDILSEDDPKQSSLQ
jgi:hypothetical protein